MTDRDELAWLIKPAHAGVDLHELRRHHQAVVRRLRRELRRRRELENRCEHLERLVVELHVTWYSSDPVVLCGQLFGPAESDTSPDG